MNIPEEHKIMVNGKWVIVLLKVSLGGWAAWAVLILTGIQTNVKDLQTEVRDSRIRAEERIIKLENDSRQIKFCIRMMETNPGRVECKLE
jgi:hypothetical protein